MFYFNYLYLGKDKKTATILKEDLAVGSFIYLNELEKKGFNCILLANGAPNVMYPHKKIAVIDGSGNDSKVLQNVISWIVNEWKNRRKVAVLCRSGANRSPAAAASALYVTNKATSVYGAIEWMRGKRKEVGHYRDTTSEFEFAAADMIEIKLKPEFTISDDK